MQASGAKFDMVMSTKEQETFETALSARDGFNAIKEELSQVDVRQVREHTALAAPQGPGCDCTSHLSCAPLSDWQAECRNIKDKDAILLELEQGVGSDKCNSLVIGLMREALVVQTKAAHARQFNNLDQLFDDL